MHQAVMRADLASDKASYAARQKAQISVTVTDGLGPVEGVTVRVWVTSSYGMTLTGGGVTGSDGVAGLTYEVDPQLGGVGTCTIAAIATKEGFEPAQSSATFEVTA